MKNISLLEKDTIDSIYYGLNTLISISALEKDIHITKIIQELSNLDLVDFGLVFCGGTCLSKAYGIIERMSEDVDFKLILKDSSKVLSDNQLRTSLRVVKSSINEHLISLGYIGDNDQVVTARDNNKAMVFKIPYISSYEKNSVLRDCIQIELNYTVLQFDTKIKVINFLYSRLIPDLKKETGEINCISLEEAFCEKLIAFPRRLSHSIANGGVDSIDHTLVRHLYDIHQIKEKIPNVYKDQKLIKQLMSNLINSDGIEFKNQHPKFIENPIGEFGTAMSYAIDSIKIRQHYGDFLDAMVYQEKSKQPTFDEAITSFKESLDLSIEGYSPMAESIVPIKPKM